MEAPSSAEDQPDSLLPAQDSLSRTDIKPMLSTAWWALRLTWGIHKSLLLGLILLTLVHSTVPAVLAIAVRGIVNAVVNTIRDSTGGESDILLWLSIGFGITLIDTIGSFAMKYLQVRLQDELNVRVTSDVLEHAAKLDVGYFENPKFQDILERTQQGIAQRFSLFISKILNVLFNLLQIVFLTMILADIEPLIIAVLIAIAIPYLVFQWRLAKQRYTVEFNRTTKQRWTRYFVTRLTSQETVAEVKLLRLAPLLISKYRALMTEFRDHNKLINLRIFRGSSVFAAVSSLAFYATFARVALRVVTKGLTVGDVAVYGGAMARLRNSLENLILGVVDVLENTLYIASLREFFSFEPRLDQPVTCPQRIVKRAGDLMLTDVTFTYPDSARPAVEGVSLQIQSGETVAIVGPNGAGKTTLVKLIARLYDPDQGSILFDGVNTRDLPIDYLHSKLSFVFQQYGRYEATAAENIAYGNWQELLDNPGRIEEIARMADAHYMISQMPDGYDTFLGRMFGNYTLSGGQWQKVAIARAFARDATLLILDEPTSNLDPRAEFRIFSNFRELAKGRTTILISHRFSTVSMADRILVMDDGRIIEGGTHEQLMRQDGNYAALYRIHRRRYDNWED